MKYSTDIKDYYRRAWGLGDRVPFKYGGTWADWATNYEDQMTFEEYLQDDNIVKKPHFLDRKAEGGRIGQLVQPNVDGSRPGYSGDYTAAEKKKQGRTLVNRDGKLTLDLHTPELKKWYKKNYPDKSWWDQKYKSDILDRYYNELGREKPPKGYITTKEYAKKYGFKIYPATDAKAEGNIISNLLRRKETKEP